MATGAQAIERIAEATGVPVVTVDRIARVLKQNNPPFWSRSGQGGGKGAAHVEPVHLVNIILALAAADPITIAPKVVPTWRAKPSNPSTGWKISPDQTSDTLRRGCSFGEASIALDQYRETVYADLPKVKEDDGFWSGKGDPRCYQVLPGHTLGQALDLFINYLANPDEGERLRIALRQTDWRLQISSTGMAGVDYREEGRTFSSRFHRPDYFSLKLPGFIRSASFGFSVIETLADLWDDTQRFRVRTPFSEIFQPARLELRKEAKRIAAAAELEAGHTRELIKHQPLSLLDAPDSATPENETAAVHPLQGTNAAALSNQPAQTELDGQADHHPTGERENSQPPSESQADHSPQQRIDPYDEPGTGGSYCAAA